MLVAITSEGSGLDSLMDPRFGRAAGFLLVDSGTMQYRYLANEALQAFGGAGIAAAQRMVKENVEAVITGHLGSNAVEVLTAARIQGYAGLPGKTINENLLEFLAGKLALLNMQTSREGQHHGGQHG